jgi:hypothetical protein
MSDESKIIANTKNALKQYGIDTSDCTAEIVDIGPDNVSFIVRVIGELYYVVVDDYLSDDAIYVAQATYRGISDLDPLKLLRPGIDGNYVTMLDNYMVCKVYKADTISG